MLERCLVVAVIGCGASPSPMPAVASSARPTHFQIEDPERSPSSGLGVTFLLRDRIVAYYAQMGELPPSAAPMPEGDRCNPPTSTFPILPTETWFADPGWRALRFHEHHGSRFVFQWTRTDATAGTLTAVSDISCDGDLTTYRVEITVDHGQATAKVIVPEHADEE